VNDRLEGARTGASPGRWRGKGRELWRLIKAAAINWDRHNAMEMAAAIAFYAAFSLAPLLLIAIAVAGMVFGQDAVREEVVGQVSAMVGKGGGELADTVIENSSKPQKTMTATLVGVAGLLLGASGAFAQLKWSLNRIWEVKLKPGQGIVRFLRGRVVSFAMVLVIGFLLLVSLAVSALLAGVGEWADARLPGWALVLGAANPVISLVVITVLFALIFRFLPDAEIGWREVWIGAAVTSILFAIGKTLIGEYLGRSSPGSVYGAAGSLAIMLLWLYYSAMIFLFGAEITRAHAMRLGKEVVPRKNAEACPGAGERGAGRR
jgi:membrane protein